MLRQFVFGKPSVLDEAIADILTEMRSEKKDSERYKALVYNLDSLMQMKTYEGKNRVSPDTVFIMAADALIVLLVITYEKKDVWTTKALSMIRRPKSPNIL